MIQGTVNEAFEAVVVLPLRGPAGQTRDVDAVVDAGFTRFFIPLLNEPRIRICIF